MTYGTKGGARQDVWSKVTWTVPPAKKLHRGAVQGAEKVPHRLTGGGKRGIIESGRVSALNISTIDNPIEQQHTGKGNPNAILMFGIDLNNRQKALLESLPDYDSRKVVPRDSVNMSDLAALTAYTGHEFAMFTKGNERLIVRGGKKNVNIDTLEAERLSADGYRWSGHTHPGIDFLSMQPSDGDYAVLACFKQTNSVIYNSKGDFRTFEKRE